jgi:glycosyltransferase involved in cell wall biosynthesis
VKIAYITAGAAGMYCGTCLHDNTLAAKLIAMGHDVALIPTYTPIRTDETDVSVDRVFYGAINVFLEQKSALFRHTPWLVDRMLNTKGLLNWASSHGTSVDATELGDLTLSVLLGEDGKQAKELEKLVEWLEEFKPDIVHLSNSMLVGMARQIRSRLKVPVLCAVQGEDIFLDELKEPYRTRVFDALKLRAADASGFTGPSAYYVRHMAEYLGVPFDRMNQIDLGLKLDGFGSGARESDSTFTIGYLARICPEKGLHVLVEAFRDLLKREGGDRARLLIAGYSGERDRAYLDGILAQLKTWGIDQQVTNLGEVDRKGKIDFLNQLDVLSVPTIYRESKGLYVLEALASGVPVVQPRHGAFPELVERTGGGELYDPDSKGALTDTLAALMADPSHRQRLGSQGRSVVHRDYNDEVMATRTLEVYESYLKGA